LSKSKVRSTTFGRLPITAGFGEMAQGPAPIYNFRERVEVVSKDPEVDAKRILRDFTRVGHFVAQ
jgi:hypothetical protein